MFDHKRNVARAKERNDEIRRKLSEGMSGPEAAKLYGITTQRVYQIKHEKSNDRSTS